MIFQPFLFFFCHTQLNSRFKHFIHRCNSLGNPRVSGFNTSHLPPKELKIKDTTEDVKSVSYLYLHIKIDGQGPLLTTIYEKQDDFSFRIVNFPVICGNIPSAHTYNVLILQLTHTLYLSLP